MFGKDTEDIEIPSSFITRGSYLDLLRLIQEVEEDWKVNYEGKGEDEEKEKKGKGLEIILSRSDQAWEWPLIDLAILLLLLPSLMTIASIIVHRFRLIRQRRKDRAPEETVLNLPCLIWRSDGMKWEKVEENQKTKSNKDVKKVLDDEESSAGEVDLNQSQEREQDPGPSKPKSKPQASTSTSSSSQEFTPSYGNECSICLDDFQDGDKVRILPCGHIFHRDEIDDWLTRIKKLCPICKRDITGELLISFSCFQAKSIG